MRATTFLTATILLILCGTFVTAQEEPAPANGETQPEPLPALPTAPYAKEDEEALNKHIEAKQAQLETARTKLKEAKDSAAEEGISDEEKAARDKLVTELETTISALQQELKDLRAAVQAAKVGPTREQLDARRRYDEAYALAVQVSKDLQVRNDDEQAADAMPEGAYAMRIREAEEEHRRIRDLAEQAEEFEFGKSRVYEKLSDLEKLDYEMRWANHRKQLSIDSYDYLKTEVFGAYRIYELRAIEGLNAIHRAKELWGKIEGTPAQQLELPEVARPVTDLTMATGNPEQVIRQLYTGRLPSQRASGPLRLRKWENRLRAIQQEIDVREDYAERLEQDSERLKEILAAAESNSNGAPTGAEAAMSPKEELEEYQKLGERIDDFEGDVIENRKEIEKLQAERETLLKAHAGKVVEEAAVQAEVQATQDLITAIERSFLPEDKLPELENPPSLPEEPRVTIPLYAYAPERNSFHSPSILLFTLREELKGQKERLSSAKRDTRQAQVQIDIVDRRIEVLTQRNNEIEETRLPEARKQYYEEIGKTVGIRAGKVAIVVLVAWLILFLIRKLGEPLIERIVSRADKNKSFSADEQQRTRTLMTVFMTTARLVVYITAIMFAIAQFDVDYGPLLVAAGGVSLAVGFGAQTLVKDFFAGFFILLEGQYSIGDVVEVGGKVGTVEHIGLRTTVLRSLSGDVHTIPNGEISATTNMTKLWSRAVVDVGVAYEENVDDIGQVIEAVAKELRDDEVWGQKVLDTIYMGVQELGDSAVVLRMLLKTRAGEQWGASREFNRRCKLKFDELGIEIPWPQRVVSYKNYTDRSEEELKREARRKRANLLRYTRVVRGEAAEEDAELAAMSVEERDRAETLAKREVELAKEESKDEPQTPAEVAEERKEEAGGEENLSAAEKWAKKQATQAVTKEQIEERQQQMPEDADEVGDAPGSGDADGDGDK